ncbi:thioredoxin family protein [Bdellovibrionales bacterium]|nr:thioredoxin family protein [Bdellovibrionales bacterium]
MSLTYTPTTAIGTPCPDFSLLSVTGERFNLASFSSAEALVVMFICNHCPYVQAIEERYIQLAADLKPSNVQVVGICSNDSTDYEEDRPENLKIRWEKKKYGFPYLYDESQEVAKSFGAVCTPDLFVYNRERTLIYRGRLDDSWRDEKKVEHQDLKEAILAYLSDKTIKEEQIPAMGCSIKWKSPNKLRKLRDTLDLDITH